MLDYINKSLMFVIFMVILCWYATLRTVVQYLGTTA